MTWMAPSFEISIIAFFAPAPSAMRTPISRGRLFAANARELARRRKTPFRPNQFRSKIHIVEG